MNNLKNFQFEVWRNYNCDSCSFRMEFPEYTGTKSLSRISFIMSREELKEIANSTFASANDGYTNLRVMEDRLSFYYLELPTDLGGGVYDLKYFNLNVPKFFVKMLYRLAVRIWGPHGIKREEIERKEFTFSSQYLERISRLYGRGKGSVKFNWTPATKKLIESISNESLQFRELFDRLVNMAKNSTRGFHQSGTLTIMEEHGSFYWATYEPNGNRIMNGGLINHHDKKDQGGLHDWSIHT